MNEREFFNSDGVYVSLTRFVASGQTYAMSGVTSVSAKEIKPSSLSTIILFIVGFLALLIGVFGSMASLVTGLVFLALAGMSLAFQKTEYAVQLTISSGEVRALKSNDRAFISNVVQALNDSIVARG